jgi:hypothetical protein
MEWRAAVAPHNGDRSLSAVGDGDRVPPSPVRASLSCHYGLFSEPASAVTGFSGLTEKPVTACWT